MNTGNTDGEILILEAARLSYPELFGTVARLPHVEKDLFNGAGALEAVFGGLNPLPDSLRETAAPAPPLPGPAGKAGGAALDIASVRADFPILREKVNGRDLIWLDNAATTQKPCCVIDRLTEFYARCNSNIHRGAHTLARRATDAYESARSATARFLNAGSPEEIVFVRGTTEAVNLVASSYGLERIREGDEILVSEMEHHANIVPWQLLCRRTGARLRVFPVDDTGQVDLSAYGACLTPRTRLVAFPHVSNVLGTVTPAGELIHMAHRVGAAALVDGAQAAAHLPVDVRALDADFYAFSGHKLYGPTGIGVLYGKYGLLEAMAPYQGGGNMISRVTMAESVFQKPPHKFEAGTGSIADAAALETALRYVSGLGLHIIEAYERELLCYVTLRLKSVSGLTVVGTAAQKSGIVSFCLDGIDSDDAAKYLDEAGVAVRAGHHCAQPVLRRFGLEKTVRASLAVYNTVDELDEFISSLRRLSRRV